MVHMKANRIVAYLLFSLALFPFAGLFPANSAGNPKGFGAFVFVGFFVTMAGWIIGDF